MSEPFESSQAPDQIPSISMRDPWAVRLRGFGPLGVLAIIIIVLGNMLFVPLSAVLILIWARLSGTPWRDLGFVPPKSWSRIIPIAIVFGIAFKFLMKALVMPLLGAPPVNEAYHFLAGNTVAIPEMLYLIIVGAGFGEETFFRGYMFERLGRLFRQSVAARVAIILISSVLFAAAHYPGQGIPGVQQAFAVGLVFGTIFAVTGQIFMLMIAHAVFDLTALAMIYWNFETAVAHLVFK